MTVVETAPARTDGFQSFPASRILSNRQAQNTFATAIWLAIPAEWYYLQTISGSLPRSQFALSVLVTFLCLLSCVVIASAATRKDRGTKIITQKRRAWVLSLASTWVVTVILLVASTYTLTMYNENFSTDWLNHFAHTRVNLFCGSHEVVTKICVWLNLVGPAEIRFSPYSLAIFFFYALLAIIIIDLVTRLTLPRVQTQSAISNPNSFVVALAVAAVLLVTHASTQYTASIWKSIFGLFANP